MLLSIRKILCLYIYSNTNTPNGIITKLDTFKGKKALVGDYSCFSYFNTKMVLESLGIEYEIVSTIDEIINKIHAGNKYDIIFTNNIYMGGGIGQILLRLLKDIKGFDTPIIIHTISDNTDNYFINLGFDGYLKKTIKQDETINVLKNLL